MKLSFGIDEDSRSIYLITGNDLETVVMNSFVEMCMKGVSLKLVKVSAGSDTPETYRISMQLNGKEKLKENE